MPDEASPRTWAETVTAADAELTRLVPSGSLYAVGGRVRDEIRSELDGVSRPAKDLDYIVTGIEGDELLARLRAGGRADLVGASFAVVKWTVGTITADVALPRRERSTGVGHRDFAVEAGPQVSLEDDLARRDFRMNMVARALPARTIVDPYAGAADIAARRIDILRDEAFAEDPLRLLRAAQFAARFAFAPSERAFAAMRAAAPLVATVSPERVRDELAKLLELAGRPSIGFELLRETGVLASVLPELVEGVGIEQNEYHAFDVYRHTIAVLDATPPGDLVLRLAALFHDIAKPRTKMGPHFYGHENVGETLTRAALERLRFPNDVIERVAGLVKHHMYAADPELAPGTIRRFVRRVGPENLDRQFALRAADVAGSGLPARGRSNEAFEARVREVVAARPPLAAKDLAVGGRDVIAAAVRAGRLPAESAGGPLVGEVLKKLLEIVLDRPELNSREHLLAVLADEFPVR
ncbi:MAG: HD domain-containing protein [Candidatus Eremiobacteraeota bacterium]|nr:HD domain-containing protein [Candidatus Eremiobacteraeota bacterium]